MTRVVEMPLWLLLLILAFAAVTFASHFLFPSVRWFFRKRAERVVAKINERLRRPIEPFKLARRFDTIQRLTYDVEVLKAVAAHAAATGVPEAVALEEARDYAREIVPRFSATLYFGIAARLARFISRSLFRVRMIHFDEAAQAVPEGAAVVYVMNHRSNMDYVLVTYLAARNAALSYAVGEWARVWPLSGLIRSLGGYFIRRRSRNDLYRRVLARYVKMATAEGLTQAVFPEGGLSLNGALGPPKLGILHYMIDGNDTREVIFVPVSLNYDRVLEDRLLLRASAKGERRFRVGLRAAAGYLWRYYRRRFANRDYRFGTAAAVFGAPIRLSEARAASKGDLTVAVASELMARIKAAMPVLPVPLIATVMAGAADGITQAALLADVRTLLDQLNSARVYLPDGGLEPALEEAVQGLVLRRVLRRDQDLIRPLEGQENVLAYYARSIAHLVPERGEMGAERKSVRDI